MPLNQDFEELLSLFNAARIRYLVVGAYAVMYHAEPRYTKDIDLWIDPRPSNAKKVYRILSEFGAPLQNIAAEDFMNPKMIYQIGIEPNRIDILMGIGSPSFDQAWENREETTYGKAKMNVIGLSDLMKAKKEADRPHDRKDLEVLSQAQKRFRKKT